MPKSIILDMGKDVFHHMNIHSAAGMLITKSGNDTGHHFGGNRALRRRGHPTPTQSAQVFDTDLHPFLAPQRLSHMFQQDLTRGSQPKPARQPLEDRGAQLFFKGPPVKGSSV